MISMSETSDRDARVKSLMREIRTSGSVRDGYGVSHGLILWHSADRKNGANREHKLNLTEML